MMAHPREYDIAKTAPLEFTPGCEVPHCERLAAHAIQCGACADVRSLFCGVHVDGLKVASGVAQCGGCGAAAPRHLALYNVVPLGAWLLGGSR